MEKKKEQKKGKFRNFESGSVVGTTTMVPDAYLTSHVLSLLAAFQVLEVYAGVVDI